MAVVILGGIVTSTALNTLVSGARSMKHEDLADLIEGRFERFGG